MPCTPQLPRDSSHGRMANVLCDAGLTNQREGGAEVSSLGAERSLNTARRYDLTKRVDCIFFFFYSLYFFSTCLMDLCQSVITNFTFAIIKTFFLFYTNKNDNLKCIQ